MAKKKDLSPNAYISAGKFKSKTATPEQKEIVRDLYKRVNKRLANISKNRNLPQMAVDRFNENVKGKLRNLDNMTKRETTRLYDELNYIENLKSSTVQGGKDINKMGIELMGEDYTGLTTGKQTALWELMHKIEESSRVSGIGSMGSLQTIADIRVAEEQGFIQFRQLRDSKGRFSSNYEAYITDSSGNPMSITEFTKERPIDLARRDEIFTNINRTRNARLLKGF